MNHSHDEMETQPPASLSTLPVEMLLSIARHLQPRDVYHLGLASRRLFESVARPFDSTDPLRMRLWKAVDGDKKPGDFQDILRHIFIQPSNDVFKLLLENKSGPGADSAELCNAFEEFGRMCQSTMAMEPQCTERSCAYNPFHDRSLNPDYNYYWFDIGAVAASTLENMCRATYDHIAPSKRDRIHQHSAAGRWSLLSLEFRLEVTETDLADIASTGPVSRVLVHPSLCIGTVIINSANTDHRMHVHGTSTWTTLMRQISMSRLTHIEMYMCDLSSVDALQLALDGLPPTLNRLHLEDCSITENGARMIATKFHAAVFRLGNFSLRDNAIGDQGVEAIVQSLLVHTTLHRLDVIGTGCGPRTLASITNLLRTNMSLRLIRTLQGCHAWSRGDYDALVRAIAHVIKQLGLTQRAIEWDDDEFFIYTPLEDDYGASTNLP